jgi:CRISPR-associated endonuclease Cas1
MIPVADISPAAAIFAHDPANPRVLVVDGYGLTLSVERGHLLIRDGLGKHRRERRLPRAQRTVQRILILGRTGHITLEAIRWCHDTGIAIVQLDVNGTLLLTAGRPGVDDARLRRAQAAAAGSPVGLDIAHGLLGAKIDGQAAIAATLLDAHHVADLISEAREQLRDTVDLVQCRSLEAQASNSYFGAWTGSVACRFAARDAEKVPSHWAVFGSRASQLRRSGRSPRDAADPINALLNYGYALAEAEARLAVLAVGLDPGLGIVHTDIRNRDSLALDLLEPLRPVVERHILTLLAATHFTRADFHETRQGACRLLPPLTHELAAHMAEYAQAVAPIAEQVAHALASSSPGKIALTTPLSRANIAAVQKRGSKPRTTAPAAPVKTMPTCKSCGTKLFNKTRQYCTACWTVTRAALNDQRIQASRTAIAAARADGRDPSQTVEARVKRHESLLTAKAAEREWDAGGTHPVITEQQLYEEVLPRLADVPLSKIERATGLSNSSCSRIRSGRMTPHPRHWDALARLAEVDAILIKRSHTVDAAIWC